MPATPSPARSPLARPSLARPSRTRSPRRPARLTVALGATLGATVCVFGVAVAPVQAATTVRVANAMPDSELRGGVDRCAGAPVPCATWAGTDDLRDGDHTDHVDDHTARRPLDGFLVGSVPAGVGALVTDFAFEWEDVAHRSRVWESGPDAEGGYRVDLTVDVLRGESLTSAQALRDYLTDYYERDPATWRLDPFKQHGQPGWHDDTIAFWLAAPGVGVAVKVDRERFGTGDLLRTAYGIRPVTR